MVKPMRRFSPFLQVLVGLLLLTAAVLKADGLLLEEKIEEGLLGNRVFLTGVVGGEILLAAWLLSGLAAAWSRRVAMGLFGLFALVTLCKGLAGASSCGCFGRFEVNPWWTLLLDVGVFTGLWIFPPTGDAATRPCPAGRPGHGKMPWASRAGVTVLCLLVAVAMTGRMIHSRASALDSEGVVAGPDGLLILEPEKWLGRPLPIASSIDIGKRLKRDSCWEQAFSECDLRGWLLSQEQGARFVRPPGFIPWTALQLTAQIGLPLLIMSAIIGEVRRRKSQREQTDISPETT
jgi:hypothetical protein